jgi:HK97 family phage major capsid protein
VTAAGELKPASSPGWQEVTIPVVTIAHVTTVDNALLADVEQTRSVIDQEMVAGLIAAENQELLNGSGAGHIAGLLASAAATPVTITAGEPVAEALHRGLTTLRVEAFSEPDGIVLHPADLEALRFAKATGSGVYLAGDPLEADAARLWGVPIVATTRIAEGTALVGSFAVAARLYVRQAPVVEMSPFAGESFQRNLVMLRCEERIGLGVVRPQALCSVDLIGSET